MAAAGAGGTGPTATGISEIPAVIRTFPGATGDFLRRVCTSGKLCPDEVKDVGARVAAIIGDGKDPPMFGHVLLEARFKHAVPKTSENTLVLDTPRDGSCLFTCLALWQLLLDVLDGKISAETFRKYGRSTASPDIAFLGGEFDRKLPPRLRKTRYRSQTTAHCRMHFCRN